MQRTLAAFESARNELDRTLFGRRLLLIHCALPVGKFSESLAAASSSLLLLSANAEATESK